jgi:hypothetical protein
MELIKLSGKKTVIMEISITKLIKSVKFKKRLIYLFKKIIKTIPYN